MFLTRHRVAQPETCDAVSALRVYVLAIKLGERSIAAAALICTFQGKYSAFPTHLVESLPPKALNTLVRLPDASTPLCTILKGIHASDIGSTALPEAGRTVYRDGTTK